MNMNPNLKDVIEKSQGKIITDVGCDVVGI